MRLGVTGMSDILEAARSACVKETLLEMLGDHPANAIAYPVG